MARGRREHLLGERMSGGCRRRLGLAPPSRCCPLSSGEVGEAQELQEPGMLMAASPC